jgi:EAL domain-containing protein (putative c-di-GMP-specific phosphodiesterase class I)
MIPCCCQAASWRQASSCRLDDPQAVIDLLRPLRDAGTRIALDDFGMGYAGLRQ